VNALVYVVSSAGWFTAGCGAGWVLNDVVRRTRRRVAVVIEENHDEPAA
jgi:hypothetical protein